MVVLKNNFNEEKSLTEAVQVHCIINFSQIKLLETIDSKTVVKLSK